MQLTFYVLISYPDTLLNLLVLTGVCVLSLGFATWAYVVWKAYFISSFWIWVPFVSFPCLNFLARTSSTMLEKVEKAIILILFPNLEEKLSLIMMLAVTFSYTIFIIWVDILLFLVNSFIFFNWVNLSWVPVTCNQKIPYQNKHVMLFENTWYRQRWTLIAHLAHLA